MLPMSFIHVWLFYKLSNCGNDTGKPTIHVFRVHWACLRTQQCRESLAELACLRQSKEWMQLGHRHITLGQFKTVFFFPFSPQPGKTCLLPVYSSTYLRWMHPGQSVLDVSYLRNNFFIMHLTQKFIFINQRELSWQDNCDKPSQIYCKTTYVPTLLAPI